MVVLFCATTIWRYYNMMTNFCDSTIWLFGITIWWYFLLYYNMLVLQYGGTFSWCYSMVVRFCGTIIWLYVFVVLQYAGTKIL